MHFGAQPAYNIIILNARRRSIEECFVFLYCNRVFGYNFFAYSAADRHNTALDLGPATREHA